MSPEMAPELAPRPATVEELHSRKNDGINVTLFWDTENNTSFITVDDTKVGDFFEIPVGADQNPMDIFNHPYAYRPEPTDQAA